MAVNVPLKPAVAALDEDARQQPKNQSERATSEASKKDTNTQTTQNKSSALAPKTSLDIERELLHNPHSVTAQNFSFAAMIVGAIRALKALQHTLIRLLQHLEKEETLPQSRANDQTTDSAVVRPTPALRPTRIIIAKLLNRLDVLMQQSNELKQELDSIKSKQTKSEAVLTNFMSTLVDYVAKAVGHKYGLAAQTGFTHSAQAHTPHWGELTLQPASPTSGFYNRFQPLLNSWIRTAHDCTEHDAEAVVSAAEQQAKVTEVEQQSVLDALYGWRAGEQRIHELQQSYQQLQQKINQLSKKINQLRGEINLSHSSAPIPTGYGSQWNNPVPSAPPAPEDQQTQEYNSAYIPTPNPGQGGS